MFDNWASDPEVTKYLTWPAHSSVDVSRFILADWMKHYAEPDFYQWAIVLDGHAIGSIAVVSHNDRAEVAHIGYCLGQKWWHMGIMSEALKAVMDFLFDEVGYQRIESRHDPRNPHSGGVMRKCGMQFEGRMRQKLMNKGRYVDVDLYAILRCDYQKR